ncbi:SAM-dependent methyltransferase [Prauserella sp. PE36]|uniref:Methyltransferase domain-containing protein n=1 Tax=Prauserella endophytica TaxID=1592324 RepID=A0ABY2SA39_9PSEU|nr:MULTISPECIES: methyltransferase domain-containing protein [Prauserella]PXY29341.1 SAM-dependent methyltransferase [Prauserella coralliicola]RBM20893.1 SAM-dependent methyltransferase [Prauserella sp. PE36]TKG72331.1 methyltransferase domain-containing protein [Prauserella endophytica]
MTTRTPARGLPVFLAAALRQPHLVGAVVPSSRDLGRQLATVVPRQGSPVVVELGPGTGAVSEVIDRRLPPGGRHLAVEINPRMAEHLRRRHPAMSVLCGDAAELDTLLAGVGAARVEAVVSGLPWSLFGEDLQRRVLAQVCGALGPGGGFSTFAYRHASRLAGAQRFRALLDIFFDEVIVTRTVWRNLPPALVYVCRRPVGPGAHA